MVQVRIRGFRSLRDAYLRPGHLTALVGEASGGKSNLLAAIWALLDPYAPSLLPADATSGGDGRIHIRGRLADGANVSLDVRPPGSPRRSGAAPVLFLPASLRDGSLVAPSPDSDGPEMEAVKVLRSWLGELADPLDRVAGARSATVPARALVGAMEACCTRGIEGLVVLLEEPELFLGPQAQRYLYRLLHELAEAGNQVVYSTHAPEFLNVARLEELALIERDPMRGTTIVQPEPLPADEEFRAMSEFDAERSELFLSRAAVLVEGLTEKLALPFVFAALGHDPDREGISIVECGGKSNIPLFARICLAARIPFVVVHDRDAPAGTEPEPGEKALNELIALVSAPCRTVVLEPDFEAAAGLRGHKGKPQRAWQRFRALQRSDVPRSLAEVVDTAVGLAGSRPSRGWHPTGYRKPIAGGRARVDARPMLRDPAGPPGSSAVARRDDPAPPQPGRPQTTGSA